MSNSARPQLFPLNDKSWHDALLVKTSPLIPTGVWHWTNEDGQTMFIKYRLDYYYNGEYSHKAVLPMCRLKDKWAFKLGWDQGNYQWGKLPLFNLPELTKTKKKVVVGEGEKTHDALVKLLPDYCSTTYSGGHKSWRKTNWETLIGRDVAFIPDNEQSSKNEFRKIALYLNEELKCNATVVELPEGLPNKWDFADPFPFEIDIVNLIESANVPEPLSSYEDLDADIESKRWVHIGDSVNLYWDRKKRRTVRDKNINLWYKNDTTHTRGQAIVKLHEKKVEKVDSIAFQPIDKELLTIGSQRYINAYQKKVYTPLTNNDYDISIFRDHLFTLSDEDQETFEYMEDMIAHDLQLPFENRTWCLLLKSEQGLGKSLFFKVIEKLHGINNCKWVSTEMLVDKYRPWMTKCHIIFCNEIDVSADRGKKQKLSKLKEIISEDTHAVEEKYINVFQIKNHYRLYLSSNEGVPLDLTRDDRRTMFVRINVLSEHLLKDNPNYYKNLWSFVKSEQKIREVYHHYKNVHKISSNFNKNVPFKTEAKSILVQAGRPQHFKELDELFKSREGVFKFDIVNTRDIYEQIQMAEQEQKTSLSYLTERGINEWINTISGLNFKTSFSVHGKKRRWWAIRNQDYWREPKEDQLTIIRAHFDGLLDPKHSKKNQDEELERLIDERRC